MHLKLENGPSNNGFMKCVVHVQFVIKSPWYFVCMRLPKDVKIIIHDHEKNNAHKIAMVRWESTHFPQFGMAPMFRHVQNSLEKEHAKIITYMKVFFHHNV